MKLQTFEAESMAAALARVKRELGEHAVIVQTRTVQPRGVLGWGGKTRIEITAVEGEETSKRRNVETSKPEPRNSGLRTQDSGPFPPIRNPQSAIRNSADPDPASLREEIGLIRRMVQDVLSESRRGRMPQASDDLLAMYTKLVEQDVAEELARRLIDEVRADLQSTPPGQPLDASAAREALMARVAAMLPPAEPLVIDTVGRPKLVALVGPTGVGKTTTIAKLAAHFKLREHKRVGLITVDTYRIAAVEQLKVYANILDLPLAVVMAPSEMPAALQRMADCHLILMDTAGRSQRHRERIGELKQYLDAARPDEVHLVLASNVAEATLKQAIEQFSAVGPHGLILTKLDEAAGMGLLLNVLAQVRMRISYLTNGQSVPNDIEAAGRQRLAAWILNGGEQSSPPLTKGGPGGVLSAPPRILSIPRVPPPTSSETSRVSRSA